LSQVIIIPYRCNIVTLFPLSGRAAAHLPRACGSAASLGAGSRSGGEICCGRG
jgi:hypothetical protein